MEKYDGFKGDVADFFSQFNIIAAANGYQEPTKKIVLAAYLAGPALLFYNKIKDNCENFQELEKQISEEFSSTTNPLAKFFARRQGATEDPLNYFYSLDYLGCKAGAAVDDKCFIQHFLGAANFQTKGRLGSQLYSNKQQLKDVIKQLKEIYNRGDGEADINLPVKLTNIVDVLPSSSTQGGQGDQRLSTSTRTTRNFSSPSFTPHKIPPPDQMMPRPYNFRPRNNTKPQPMMIKKNSESHTKAAEAIEVIAEETQQPHSKNIYKHGALRSEVEARGRGTESAFLHELHSTLAPPAAPDHHWQHTLFLILKGLVFATIILGAIFGNALVIISVHRHRKLRVLTNYYVVSLAVADMLVALCAMTFNASSELTDDWLFGPLVCDIYNSLDVYFSSASILHLCCISVDRYYAIVRPLEYPVTMTHRTVCFMLANVWLWPAFISFVPILMGWYTTEQHRQFKKAHPDVCIFKVNMVYAIVSSSVSFWIPSVVMISMYCRIFREAIRQREALTRTSSNILLNSVHIKHTSHTAHHSHYLHPDRRPSDISPNYSTFTEVGPEETELGGEVVMSLADICPSKEASPRKSVNVSCDTASSGYCSGGSNKRSSCGQPPPGWRASCSSAIATRDLAKAATELNAQGASLRAAGKSWRAEHKAARTLGIIVGAFLLCWLPFFIWYVTTNVCGEPCDTPSVVVGVLFWIGYFNSALNPLIYAYFNRDFRDAFKNTLMCALPCCFTCWKDTGTAQFV